MIPLFPGVQRVRPVTFAAWGPFLRGGTHGWILERPEGQEGQERTAGRLRGWRWHLPTGLLVLEAGSGGPWQDVEVHAAVPPDRLELLAAHLGPEALGLELRPVRVLAGSRTLVAHTWTGSSETLRRAGATRLRGGGSGRGSASRRP